MLSSARKAQWIALSVMMMLLLFTASSMVYAYKDAQSAKVQQEEAVEPLPVVGSVENLQKLLQEADCQDYAPLGFGTPIRKAASAMMDGGDQAAGIASESGNNKLKTVLNDYSSTNIQVEGVDEADIVKTDGQYIYQVNGKEIMVIKASPATEMEVLSRVGFDDENFSPRELLLDKKHLMLIGRSYVERDKPLQPESSEKIGICPPPYRKQITIALVYDISNKRELKEIRQIDLEGQYLSSRKVGSAVYLLSNSLINYYHSEENTPSLPSYRDTASGDNLIEVDCQHIRYFPEYIYPAYIMVAGFNIDKPQEKAEVATYLGNGENLYASVSNLYLAVNHHREAETFIRDSEFPAPPPQANTCIYRFALNDGKTDYKAKGEVPGRILNQFSMDENDGYFRIATTTGDMWRSDDYTSKNNIYVLDTKLDIKGKLEDIAPGERIYSTRFMGNRAYMVTFKDVDPFFVIDMKDPEQPEILGKLKIPGYSDYLHPYDENHIIGFGKDTIELKDGRNEGSQDYYQGLKVAIFDVSDVSNPLEICKEIIGDRGSDSELLRNHKALLFSREKNLLAFPLTVKEIEENDSNSLKKRRLPLYGSFTFQGAYVYHIDLENGLELKGRITHLDSDDYLKAGDHWYKSKANVERILYIGDDLYTLSQDMVKAHRLSDLKHINTLFLH